LDVALLEKDPDDDILCAIDAAVRWTVQLDGLNDEQRTVFDRVMVAINDKTETAQRCSTSTDPEDQVKRRYTDASYGIFATKGDPCCPLHLQELQHR